MARHRMTYIPRVKEGQCAGCLIFIGGAEEPWHLLTEYREHNLCCHCIREWKRREKVVRHEITWTGFIMGQPGKRS